MRKTQSVLLAFVMFFVTACSVATATPAPDTNFIPTQIEELTLPSTKLPTKAPANNLPLTDADVPRVTVENAKAAFDAGVAIIVDVRSQEAYDAQHIAGAIFISLADMSSNTANLKLDKNKWIITYCT
ncbi:MAG: rhodanese-like domain-containing protein [Anaerolineales bacterium]|nr:rhodanese-like domain-containing protein [Anaerolineales bacterium]